MCSVFFIASKIGAPKLLSANPMGSTAVKVEWLPPTNPAENVKYKIIFSHENVGGTVEKVVSTPAAVFAFPGLKPSTTYSVTINSLTGMVDGPLSNVLQVTTSKGGMIGFTFFKKTLF